MINKQTGSIRTPLLIFLPIILLLSMFMIISVNNSKSSPEEKLQIKEEQANPDKKSEYKKCEELGGIPIRSTWDSRLKDCIFKP